jgi:hypothetical protein
MIVHANVRAVEQQQSVNANKSGLRRQTANVGEAGLRQALASRLRGNAFLARSVSEGDHDGPPFPE